MSSINLEGGRMHEKSGVKKYLCVFGHLCRKNFVEIDMPV